MASLSSTFCTGEPGESAVTRSSTPSSAARMGPTAWWCGRTPTERPTSIAAGRGARSASVYKPDGAADWPLAQEAPHLRGGQAIRGSHELQAWATRTCTGDEAAASSRLRWNYRAGRWRGLYRSGPSRGLRFRSWASERRRRSSRRTTASDSRAAVMGAPGANAEQVWVPE